MNNSTRKKKEQLEMNPGTASSVLKKSLLFSLAQRLHEDICYQCAKKIKSVEEFSIEHKEPWLDSNDPKGLFFDLDNIAFSHLSCNVKAGRKPVKANHPSQYTYRKGCRCDGCKEEHRIFIRKCRVKGIMK